MVGALGYVLMRVKVIDQHFVDVGSGLCFKVLLPILLFKELYTSKCWTISTPGWFSSLWAAWWPSSLGVLCFDSHGDERAPRRGLAPLPTAFTAA